MTEIRKAKQNLALEGFGHLILQSNIFFGIWCLEFVI
jgi:hypothetical protein